MPDTSVRVICRFRPVNEREKSEAVTHDGTLPLLEYPNDATVVVNMPKQPQQTFNFDRVFGSDSKQMEVYSAAAKDTINDVIGGYNGTIFAYGQTGAGKSFTMFGPDISVPELKGIIPRSCEQIFKYIERDNSGTEYTIKCSFLEIYKETIRDLLSPGNDNLKVRESPSRGVWVQDLTEQFVTCEEDIIELLKMGEKYRAVSSTKMNAVSSRSHSLFIITLQQKSPEGSTKEGKLNLADLAGSEKVGKTGATGDTLEEAKKINQSLSALGNCINALTQAKKTHIPYRDSKLTFILRESLGGNSKTTLLIAASPHPFNIEETVSTLKFGQRAKTIKNKVSINQQRSVAELNAIITKLQQELDSLRRYANILERDIVTRDPKYDLDKARQDSMKEVAGAEGSPSTPNKEASAGDDGSDDDKPKARNSLTMSSYNPMALVEAQVLLEQTRERMQIEVQELKDEIQSVTSEKEELIAHMKTAQTRVEQKDHEIGVVKKLLENEREEFRMQLSKVEYDATQSKLELETQKEEIQLLHDNNKLLQDELSRTRDSLSVFESENETFKLNEAKWKEELKQLKENVSKLDKNATSDKEQLNAVTKERETLKARLHAAEEKYKRQEEEVNELRQELATIQRQYQELTAELGSATSSIGAPSGELGSSVDQIESTKNAIGELKNKNLGLQADLSKKEMEAKDLKKKLQDYEYRTEELSKDVEQLKGDYQELKSSEEEKRVQIEARLKQIEEEFSEEQTRRMNAESEVRAHKRIVAAQEKRIRSLQEANDSLKKEGQQQSVSATKQLQQANSRVSDLEKLVDELHSKNEDLKSKLDGSVEAYVQMQKKLTDRLIQQDEEISPRQHYQHRGRTNSKKGNIVVPVQNPTVKKKSSNQLANSKQNADSPNKQGFFSWLFDAGDPPAPTREDLAECRKDGYLHQISGFFRNWKERWFVLKDCNLYYFENKESRFADSIVPVDGCAVTIRKDSETAPDFKYQFVLSHPQRKTIYLCANSMQDMMEWVEALDIAASAQPPGGRARSSTVGGTPSKPAGTPTNSVPGTPSTPAAVKSPMVVTNNNNNVNVNNNTPGHARQHSTGTPIKGQQQQL
jgi:kinesin family protein 5